MEPLILRRPESARVLGVSESQHRKWETQGLVTPIKYPGIRAVGFDADEVRALADRILRPARISQRS